MGFYVGYLHFIAQGLHIGGNSGRIGSEYTHHPSAEEFAHGIGDVESIVF